MFEPRADLEARVARLERLVAKLVSGQEIPARPDMPGPAGPVPRSPPGGAPSSSPEPSPSGSTPDSAARKPPTPRASRTATSAPAGWGFGERWLGRVGIAFLILAAAFLLQLSFERGWITPVVRLVGALGLGVACLVAGLRLEAGRRALTQSLLGGAVALFYLVGFAGFQLYGLLPFWLALSVMSTTTVLSVVLSEQQVSAALAVIGVLGGLATPFLLRTDTPSALGLSVYLTLVLVGGGVVQLHRGWRTLLGALVVGGSYALGPLTWLERTPWPWAAVSAVLVYWLVAGASPLLRPVFMSSPSRERRTSAADGPTGERADDDAGAQGERVDPWVARGAGAWASLAGVALLTSVLGLEWRGTAALFFMFGVALAGAALAARGQGEGVRSPPAELSAVLLACGFAWLTRDSLALFLVSAEAALLLVLAPRTSLPGLRAVGHLLVASVAIAFVVLAASAPPGGGPLRQGAVFRLGVLAMFLVSSLWVKREEKGLYRGLAYLGLMTWFLFEFQPRPHGRELVSIAWAAQGAGALLLSVRWGARALQSAGLATLGLVAVKMLALDLAGLDPVWRILMFLGFGGGLLGLAYLVNRPGPAAPE